MRWWWQQRRWRRERHSGGARVRSAGHAMLCWQRLRRWWLLRVWDLHGPGQCLREPRWDLWRRIVWQLRRAGASVLWRQSRLRGLHLGRDCLHRRHLHHVRRPGHAMLCRCRRRSRNLQWGQCGLQRQQRLHRLRHGRRRLLSGQQVRRTRLLLRRLLLGRGQCVWCDRRNLPGQPLLGLRKRDPALLREPLLRRPHVQERHLHGLRRIGPGLLRDRHGRRHLSDWNGLCDHGRVLALRRARRKLLRRERVQ
jgi:hypothetical protein